MENKSKNVTAQRNRGITGHNVIKIIHQRSTAILLPRVVANIPAIPCHCTRLSRIRCGPQSLTGLPAMLCD